jgi:tRNA A37 threonylcarbamoyladenosine dehydratase
MNRTELLLGKAAMERIETTRVILFGVGGVGSWCAESLVRSGIKHLTIVDFDIVAESNINRQLMATVQTVGKVKVDVLRERLLEINPDAEIIALQKMYSADTKDDFSIEKYDYIIDAIDSLPNKMLLIQEATRTNAVFFSSMGAARKMDSTKIQVADFWKVKGCPLAAALRQRLRKEIKVGAEVGEGNFQSLRTPHFLCVFSEERFESKGEGALGSVVHITGSFGLTLAGLVLQDIYKKNIPEH